MSAQIADTPQAAILSRARCIALAGAASHGSIRRRLFLISARLPLCVGREMSGPSLNR